ncbi:MAG: hypothetical protein JW768_12010 [Chitinispirillaceae bacterium]|nr:hypothetical protein [Chitinispirillaceae bacterium]
MRRAVVCMSFLLVVGIQGTWAQSFPVETQAGEVQVFQGNTGKRTGVMASATITMGDSLILGTMGQAVVFIEKNSRLLFKGPGALTITGDSSTAYLSFDEGQLFLDRNEPSSFSVITFWIRNYMFVPAGTAAAFKVMNSGQPAVVVIKGRVLMQSPTGEAVEVQAGKFACIEESGKITAGLLGKRLITALEKWSGVAMDGPVPNSKNSSPNILDKEFIASLADAPDRVTRAKKVSSPAAPAAAVPQAPTIKTPKTLAAAPVTPPPSQSSAKAEPAAAEAKEKPPREAAAGDAGTQKKSSAAPDRPVWNISAGSVTVEDEQWTRLAVGVDIPLWKFGIFFDIEAFIEPSGKFSDKGWRFTREDYLEAITRKIRYVRFGREQDPLFVKVGALSNVTLGYGFIVDRFTNMLHYPDRKLLGGQLYLNNISPVGITLQMFGADAQEVRTTDHGGVGAARLAVCPVKMLEIPIVSGISVGGTFAYDRNVYAPARKWKNTQEQKIALILDDGSLSQTQKQQLLDSAGIDIDGAVAQVAEENRVRRKIESFGIYGGDIGVPIISTSLLSLDVYAQAAVRNDTIHGWGVGAPGVALKVWRFNASLEYRHVKGRFVPGFFGPYYLDERLVREPAISTKVDSLPDDTLNGAFGRLGFDFFGALSVDGGYQYMIGSREGSPDQRFEVSGSLGALVADRIPKVKSAEAYLYKTRIGADIVKYDSLGATVLKDGKPVYDGFFERTPFMYYGYRIGIEITEGATLIWDSRFGWQRDGRGRLMSNNNITVQTSISF